MRFLGPGLDLSSCGFHWKKPIRNNCELCFPTQSGGCSSMTQSVAATAPASTLAVVVFIGKNQFAIIANCFFPHNLVSAIASMESVAATAPASTSAVSCVFHRKKPIRNNCELSFTTQSGGCNSRHPPRPSFANATASSAAASLAQEA